MNKLLYLLYYWENRGYDAHVCFLNDIMNLQFWKSVQPVGADTETEGSPSACNDRLRSYSRDVCVCECVCVWGDKKKKIPACNLREKEENVCLLPHSCV